MFYDTLQMLCRDRGLSVTAALQIMGVSSGNLSHWKKGRLPKGKTLQRMAQFFDIPVDTLLALRKDTLTAQRERLLSLFGAVPQEDRPALLTEIEQRVCALCDPLKRHIAQTGPVGGKAS